MLEIGRYVAEYLRSGRNAARVGISGLILALVIAANQVWGITTRAYAEWLASPPLFLFFAVLFSTGAAAAWLIQGGPAVRAQLRTRHFWSFNLTAVVTLTLLCTLHYTDMEAMARFGGEAGMVLLIINYLINSALYAFLPILGMVLIRARDRQRDIPLSARASVRPYLALLALLAPLVLAASFTEGFQAAYPIFRDASGAENFRMPAFEIVLLFEAIYGLNFVLLEFFFRGFLVVRHRDGLGETSILPMAVVYCLMHLPKPPGEAMASFFGGLVLGIVAYRTRSILGGVIVHMGIAYLMEMFALFQLLR